MNKHIFLLAALVLATACHTQHGETDTDHHHDEEGLIHLTTKQADAASLATETVQPSVFEDCIRVSGQVTTAQGDEAAMTAMSSGVVSFVRDHLTEGVAIRQGEVIARISAAAVQGGDAIAQQSAALSAARANYERAKRLVADTLISVKEYERIKLEYEQARLATGSSVSASSASGSVLSSPLTGYVQSVNVKEGEYVEAGATVATVTKSCNLQLRAELPEKYFKHINNIHSAHFVMSYGGETHNIDSLHGHLVSVGQRASAQSAYIPVTFEFVNDGCIVPGSFADIWLLTKQRDNVISVPNEAICEQQGVHYVYVQLDDDDEEDALVFEKKEVQLGMSNGMRTEVTKGIKAGEKIVVSGVTQVKLAGASGTVPEAHSHNH